MNADDLVHGIDDYMLEYTKDEDGNLIYATLMDKDTYRIKKIEDKIKEIVTLEQGKTYLLIINDGTFEDICEVNEALKDSYEKFGCKFIVVSDRFTIHDESYVEINGVKYIKEGTRAVI